MAEIFISRLERCLPPLAHRARLLRALMYREVVAEIAQDGSPLHLYLE